MTERRRTAWGVVAALLLTAGVASAAEVTSVRRGVVYVSLGAVDGVTPGSRLTVGGTVLEATEVGEKQCAAKVIEGAALAVGTPVAAPPPPPEPPKATARKPPKVLPTPERVPEGAGDELVKDLAALPHPKVVHARGEAAPREGSIHGDVQVSWVGVFDTAPDARQDLDLHAVRVRNRLTATDMGGVPLTWSHDVGFRGDFGPDLSSRRGSASRPWVELRRAALTWSPTGASLSGGRLALLLPVQGGLLDGASVAAEIGERAHIGAYGGLSADLMDLSQQGEVGRFGVNFDWLGDFDEVQVQLDGALGGSTWLGELDRTALSLSTGVYMGPLLTVVADATLDAYTSNNPAERPVVDLSDAFVAVQSQPLPWLSVDAHYAFTRQVLTREIMALWPDLADVPPATEPAHTAWLQTTFRPLPWLSVGQSAGVGFGSDWAEGLWLRSRLDFLRLPAIGTDIHLGYSFQESLVTRTQVGSVRFDQPVTDEVRVTLGYAFITSQLRHLDERYDQHEVEAGASMWLPWGLVADATTTVLLDDTLGTVVVAAVHGGWRF